MIIKCSRMAQLISKISLKMCFSPVIAEEDKIGDADDDLEPAPVSDKVGDQRQEKDADAEEHLIKNSNSASVLYSHNLCN